MIEIDQLVQEVVDETGCDEEEARKKIYRMMAYGVDESHAVQAAKEEFRDND